MTNHCPVNIRQLIVCWGLAWSHGEGWRKVHHLVPLHLRHQKLSGVRWYSENTSIHTWTWHLALYGLILRAEIPFPVLLYTTSYNKKYTNHRPKYRQIVGVRVDKKKSIQRIYLYYLRWRLLKNKFLSIWINFNYENQSNNN